MDRANGHRRLGFVMNGLGDEERASECYQDAMMTYNQVAPTSKEMAKTYNAYANILRRRGDLKEAGDYFQKAKAIFEQVAVVSAEMACVHPNLGLLLGEQVIWTGPEIVSKQLLKSLNVGHPALAS